MQPITTLPPDYKLAQRWTILEPRSRLVRLNLLALAPMALVWWGVGAFFQAYQRIGAPLAIRPGFATPSAVLLVGMLLAVILTFPAHELVHGAFMRLYGHKPRYGFRKMALYTTADNAYFRRNEYIVITVAPVVVITLAICVLILFLPPDWGAWLVIAAGIHAGGAIGDLWTLSVVLRYPESALVRDEADAFSVFLPNDQSISSV